MNHPFLTSPIGQDPAVMEAEFNAGVEKLYAAWIKADSIKKWFGAEEGGPNEASIDFKIKGHWRFTFYKEDGVQDVLSGQYLIIEPNKKLVFSWIHTRVLSSGEKEISPESKITLNFESRGDGSYMRLVHESISSDGARVNIGGGWSASISKLKRVLE